MTGIADELLLRLGDVLAPMAALDAAGFRSVVDDAGVVAPEAAWNAAAESVEAVLASSALVAAAVDAVDQAVDAAARAFAAAALVAAASATLDGLGDLEAALATSGLARAMVDYLLIRWAEVAHPVILAVGVLVGGVVRHRDVPTAAMPDPPMHRALRPERLVRALHSPSALLAELYGDGLGEWDADALLGVIGDAVAAAAAYARRVDGAEGAHLELAAFDLHVASSGVRAVPIGLLAEPFAYSASWQTSEWRVDASCEPIPEGAAVAMSSSGDITAEGVGIQSLGFEASLRYVGAAPLSVVAIPGVRLAVGSLRLLVSVTASASGGALTVGVSLEQGVAQITPGTLLGPFLGGMSSVTFDGGLTWTLQRGLTINGATGTEVQLPWRGARSSGVETLTLALVRADGDSSQIRLALTLGVRVGIGPGVVRVQGLGVTLRVATDARSRGALGPLDIETNAAIPDGAWLELDAAGVYGGGFLRHVATGRYVGVLDVDALGVRAAAAGVLDTSAGGYSFVATIGAEFSPVQLGLGFTLDGVGGLIGIHRRVDTDALRAALRSPAGMGDIFFAADPIAQAARLTTDLATYFPAAEGRYVFGPAVKFGWGTPTMVRGELAVLLELPAPARVVVLGTVSAKLPSVDHAIIDLALDVVGEVDFAQKRVAIDASLRGDSSIAGFPITGDMAFRMSWGSPPSFLLSIGGFHSEFPVPPGFPELRRIQIPLGSGDNPRLDAQGFLALTSNTAQIGASIDLYAAAGPLNIKGNLGFETLLTFSPFHLEVDVWAGVALRRGESTLASIHFDGHLSGPNPWRVDGKACLSCWLFDLCVPIHFAFGPDQAVVLPTYEIWPALQEALATPEAWANVTPVGLATAVTAPPLGEAAVTRVDPCATLTVTQKVVPLDRQITAFAQGRPEGTDRFEVTRVTLGATTVPASQIAPVKEWFAPAQFEEMSEPDKLSRPGFEQMVGGVSVGAKTIRAGAPLVRTLDYDTVVVVNGQPQQEAPRYRPTRLEQLEGTRSSSTARPPLRATGPAAFAPPAGTAPRLQLVNETFVIASTYDLTARWDVSAAGTRGQAELALRAYLAAHPGDAGTLQVVPAFEVAA